MLKWGNGPLQENLTVLKRLENLLGEKNLVLAQCNHHRPEQAEKPWVMMGIKKKADFWTVKQPVCRDFPNIRNAVSTKQPSGNWDQI